MDTGLAHIQTNISVTMPYEMLECRFSSLRHKLTIIVVPSIHTSPKVTNSVYILEIFALIESAPSSSMQYTSERRLSSRTIKMLKVALHYIDLHLIISSL